MLSNRLVLPVALTALAPMLWGTTYWTTTRLLLPDHPLTTATLRALPAGLILLAIGHRLPRGDWWWRAALLGALNIAVFFICLFVAAGRLPGGVAAVVGGIQPLLVAVLASVVLAERLTGAVIVAGLAGVAGVALLVTQARSALDPVGVVAALLGAASMATGTVLTRRWGKDVPPLVLTSWQLLLGGLLLVPITLVVEPLPAARFSPTAVAGYAYLALLGTAVAYLLWFRGIARLPTRVPAFLGLLSPVVALTIGVTMAGETLAWAQVAGLVLVLGAIAVVIRSATRAVAADLAEPVGSGPERTSWRRATARRNA
ncbi:EamA family transporter [Tersicoccus sp. MR15.9]|uniref:EamA family transporter n=1 Tax=Tersicoccus mangrovi TaxID=3121635 RepID=UPI002FE6A4A4